MDGVLTAPTYESFAVALRESGCSRCAALCSTRTNIVVDRGAPSPLMIIGEAPGENEDLQGRAFVGRGGKLFDRLIASIGIDTNRDALIANVLKCRPPDNRPPTKAEAENCKPFLLRQIALVRPRIVVLLGATALRHFVPEAAGARMKDRVGRFFDVAEHPGISFQLLYHPAFLLRDPRRQPETLEHLKALKSRLDGLCQIDGARSNGVR